MRSSNPRLFLALFLALILTPSAMHAQGSSTSTVTGTVADQNGAAVPAATVELINVATNESRLQTTSDTGYYTFVSVAPGSYKVIIKKSAFRTTSVAIDVMVGKVATVDVKLELGTVAETVEVVAGAAVELQTQDASVGNVMERKTLDNIPSLARDATALLLLQPLATPGFNSPGSPNSTGEGDNTGGQIAGARSDQNTFLLDGGDATDSTAGSGQYSGTNFTATPRAVVPTPIESLEEFRVVTTNSSASFSRSAGGEVQMVTRRGTNQFHGAVYEYLQNNVLNANTWDRNSSNIENPALRDNRYGGRLGGPIWKDKTFFFAHYEGRRFVSSNDIVRRVPSCDMKLGILNFGGVEYNLNPATINDCAGTPVAPANCGTAATPAPCDPRGLGLNSTIKAVWALEPAGNKATCAGGDGINTLCFDAPVSTPLSEDFGVIRVDHNISSKWQFTSSYRYGKTTFSAPVQVDIGGLLAGDQLGVPKSVAHRPLAPRYLVTSLTGQLTPHLTSQSTFDYLRHWWQWGTLHPTNIPGPEGGYAQTNGLNASLSISGEGICANGSGPTSCGMQPINVDTQNARSRTWNGKDYNFNENLSWIKGNHLVQFGGRTEWQRFYHQRDDKVVGGLTSPVFTIGRLSSGSHVSGVPFPAGFSGSASRWRTDYASILGIVERSQELLTRAPDFSPNTPGVPLKQNTVVDSDSLYVSDSWRLKPSFTLTLGLNWGIQLPPYESSGEQTIVVDHSTGKPINFDNYMATRKSMASAGQLYNPQLDYVPIKQTGRKYPYDPDWTNFSPRVAFAWNPSSSSGFLGGLFGGHKSVLRGGYARVYDRINGVGIVMIPALGVGFGNNLRCAGPHQTGTGIACGTSNPSNAFRITTDGTQLPLPALASIPSGQPLIPNVNSPYESLDFRIDPKRKVGYAHTFDLTYQRDLGHNMLMEIGYVGNYAQRLYQGYALQAVPYMYTLGGQSFAKAFSNIAQAIIANPSIARTAIPGQPFIEAFLAGQCAGYTSCTQMVVSDPKTNPNAFADDLSGFATFNFTDFWEQYSPAEGGPDQTQVLDSYIIGSHGHSNYNAGFLTLRKTSAAGLTFNFNYTYSHAFDQIGQNQESLNEASDAFNLDRDYGSASFDRRHAITTLVTYDLPFGAGRRYSTANGVANKVIGGWNVSGVWSFATGLPLDVINGGSCQELGQGVVFGNCSAYFPISGKYQSASVHNNGGALTAYSNADAINNDPLGGFSFFTPPDPAIYGRTGRGYFRGLNRWNVDFGVSKTTKITERVSTRFDCQMTNVFNHVMFGDPSTDISSGSFGTLTTQYNQPRYIQFGLRFDF
jgi:Carboxypeptidase regulatory-like domain